MPRFFHPDPLVAQTCVPLAPAAARHAQVVRLQPGDAVRLTWPRHGLAGGRVLIVRAVSVRGDRTDVLMWG